MQTMDKDHPVARQLKQLRSYYGLTQSEFADKIGVSHATIVNWERGQIPKIVDVLIQADQLSFQIPSLKPEFHLIWHPTELDLRRGDHGLSFTDQQIEYFKAAAFKIFEFAHP